MGEHAGEYVRGDIMDANAVIQAFDELKGNVDNNHDSLEEIVNEIHNFRDTTNHRFDVFQEKAEEETANRIQGDNTLDDKIDQKEIESNERDNILQQNIDTEKHERVNADTQLRNDLTAEVNRAKANENALSSDIHAEATKRENDDNTIKDNLNAEVTRATAKENEIKAEVDIINGDSTTEGSFRKAIADVVGAAPEAYDTLKEIADKLNDNDDLHTAINDAIATKATTVALNEEITRAKAAEAENKAEIAAEAARAKEVEGDNALAIQNEASRATTVETAINESLNTEIDRAKGQEAYLQNLVNAKADTTALDSAKADLDKKISDETTRATGVEATKASADDLTAEITRAKQAEAAITSDVTEKIAQKADTTALNNYVLTTALNDQVDTLNAAIGAKQDAGSYIPYDSTDTSYYKINKNGLKLDDGANGNMLIVPGNLFYTRDDNYGSLTVSSSNGISGRWNNSGSYELSSRRLYTSDSNSTVELSSSGLFANGMRGENKENLFSINNTRIRLGDTNNPAVQIDDNGIKFYGRTRNEIPVANGQGFININNYALKSELPIVPTKVSQLTNDSNFITAADVDFTPYATTEALTTVEQKVDANTAAISAKQDAGNYIPYDQTDKQYYKIDRSIKISSDSCDTTYDNGHIGIMYHNNDYMHLSCNGLNAKFGKSEFQINGGGVRVNGNGDIINISKAEGLSIYDDADGHSQEVLIINGNKIELANAGVTINSFGINFLNRKDGDIPTSKAGFININDYVLKTVYDEKIAALEARIAALESKHPESAA